MVTLMPDRALAVDVFANLVEADSSRRSNDGPTANCQLPTNLVILEWRGAIDACLLGCSRNRPKKILFPYLQLLPSPDFTSQRGAEEEIPDGLLLPLASR